MKRALTAICAALATATVIWFGWQWGTCEAAKVNEEDCTECFVFFLNDSTYIAHDPSTNDRVLGYPEWSWPSDTSGNGVELDCDSAAVIWCQDSLLESTSWAYVFYNDTTVIELLRRKPVLGAVVGDSSIDRFEAFDDGVLPPYAIPDDSTFTFRHLDVDSNIVADSVEAAKIIATEGFYMGDGTGNFDVVFYGASDTLIVRFVDAASAIRFMFDELRLGGADGDSAIIKAMVTGTDGAIAFGETHDRWEFIADGGVRIGDGAVGDVWVEFDEGTATVRRIGWDNANSEIDLQAPSVAIGNEAGVDAYLYFRADGGVAGYVGWDLSDDSLRVSPIALPQFHQLSPSANDIMGKVGGKMGAMSDWNTAKTNAITSEDSTNIDRDLPWQPDTSISGTGYMPHTSADRDHYAGASGIDSGQVVLVVWTGRWPTYRPAGCGVAACDDPLGITAVCSTDGHVKVMPHSVGSAYQLGDTTYYFELLSEPN